MGKAAGVGELKQIKENYRQMLIPSSIEQDSLLSDLIKIKPEKEMSDQAVVELHQLYPFDLKKIDGYLSLMSADGSWTDINYADTKRSGWEPKLHAERILELSKLYYSKTTEYYHSEKNPSILNVGCPAGINTCAILETGDVVPCSFCADVICGNLKKEKFKDVWTNSEIFNKLRERDFEYCNKCEHNRNCGGCRVRALYKNNLYGRDPYCWKLK